MSMEGGNTYHGIQASDNARIHAGNIINLPSRRKASPRNLVFQYFSRDRAFVGREDILQKVKIKLTPGGYHNRAVLTGLGGIGKTQIAIEFAYQYAEADPDHWVFWVYAASRERLMSSYRKLALSMGITSEGSSEAQVFDGVRDWLSDSDNGHWLMIVDNVDDSEVLFEGSSDAEEPLASYIPQPSHGAVLVTSRSSAGAELSEDPETIMVGGMQPPEAVRLLNARLRQKIGSESEAETLVEMLDGIPLAITQAAAYLNQCRWPTSKYISAFQTEEQQATMLGKQWRDMRRDANVSNAVLTTWKISFDHLEKLSRKAIDMLSRMCLLDRASIPETLVVIDGDPEHEQAEAKGLLLDFAFLLEHLAGSAYTIHRLIQVCIKVVLRERGVLEHSQEHVVLLLAAKLPKRVSPDRVGFGSKPTAFVPQPEQGRQRLKELFPHMELVAKTCMTDTNVSHAQLMFLDILSHIYMARRDYRTVVVSANCMRQSSIKLGDLHVDTLSRSLLLASRLNHFGCAFEAMRISSRTRDKLRSLPCTEFGNLDLGPQWSIARSYHSLGDHNRSCSILGALFDKINLRFGIESLSACQVRTSLAEGLYARGLSRAAEDILAPAWLALARAPNTSEWSEEHIVCVFVAAQIHADISYQRQDFGSTIRYCEIILKTFGKVEPGDPLLLRRSLMMGHSKLEVGQNDEAEKFLQQVVREAYVRPGFTGLQHEAAAHLKALYKRQGRQEKMALDPLKMWAHLASMSSSRKRGYLASLHHGLLDELDDMVHAKPFPLIGGVTQ